MFQMAQKKVKNQKGFTLIELLAVIVILGIIAAIAIPSITKVIQNSRVDAVRADAVAVYNAGKLYSSQNETKQTFTDADLKGSVIDNTSLKNVNFTVDTNTGALTMSATGTAGSVTITITNATYDMINTKDNWNPSNGKITIGS